MRTCCAWYLGWQSSWTGSSSPSSHWWPLHHNPTSQNTKLRTGKVQVPCKSIGKTAQHKQIRGGTHTHVLPERRESTELVPLSPPLPHLSADWPVAREPGTPLVKMLVVPPTWQNEFDLTHLKHTWLQFCKMQSGKYDEVSDLALAKFWRLEGCSKRLDW